MRYNEKVESCLTGRHIACVNFSGSVHDEVILDVGCWIGWYEKFMVSKGCAFIVGLDVNRKALLKAKKGSSSECCAFVYGSAYSLPFKQSCFDRVSAFDVIEHVPVGSEKNFLSEINNVLKQNGKLVLTTPADNLLSNLFDPAYFLVGHRHYSLDTLKNMLNETNFTLNESKTAGGIVEALAMVLLYFFKHIFDMTVPFRSFFEYLRNKEYTKKKGISTLFIKASKACT